MFSTATSYNWVSYIIREYNVTYLMIESIDKNQTFNNSLELNI